MQSRLLQLVLDQSVKSLREQTLQQVGEPHTTKSDDVQVLSITSRSQITRIFAASLRRRTAYQPARSDRISSTTSRCRNPHRLQKPSGVTVSTTLYDPAPSTPANLSTCLETTQPPAPLHTEQGTSYTTKSGTSSDAGHSSYNCSLG